MWTYYIICLLVEAYVTYVLIWVKWEEINHKSKYVILEGGYILGAIMKPE